MASKASNKKKGKEVMAKTSNRKTKKQIEMEEIKLAAEQATVEAMRELESDDSVSFESPEERDMNLVSQDDDETPDFEREQKDVFADGKAGAKKRFKSVNFRVYRDEKWLGTKRGDYSWESLQKDYGGGSFRIVAVDSDNKFITSQALEVEYPEGWNERVEQSISSGPVAPSPLEMIEVMKENQREAESKSASQQNGLATIMSTVMQAQQQANQNMMQMMVESNKQNQTMLLALLGKQNESKGPDPMMSMLSIFMPLLTQKPVSNEMKPLELLSLTEKIKESAKAEERRNHENQKKEIAEAIGELRETMAVGGEVAEEGGLKGLIKGFIPIITEIVKNQQANQPTAEQMAQMQAERNLQGGSQALDQGFIDRQAQKPMVAAPPQMRRPSPQPQARPQPQVVQPNPGVGGGSTTQGESIIVNGQGTVVGTQSSTQELVLNARQKDLIFDSCAGDIGQALMQREAASKTAGLVLEKLEKEGLSRQTIAKAYTLVDFNGYAMRYGLPEEVKPWLKDFHESIQKMASPQSVRLTPDSVAPTKLVNPAANGNGTGVPVSAKRVADSGNRPRTQPRSNPKDL